MPVVIGKLAERDSRMIGAQQALVVGIILEILGILLVLMLLAWANTRKRENLLLNFFALVLAVVFLCWLGPLLLRQGGADPNWRWLPDLIAWPSCGCGIVLLLISFLGFWATREAMQDRVELEWYPTWSWWQGRPAQATAATPDASAGSTTTVDRAQPFMAILLGILSIVLFVSGLYLVINCGAKILAPPLGNLVLKVREANRAGLAGFQAKQSPFEVSFAEDQLEVAVRNYWRDELKKRLVVEKNNATDLHINNVTYKLNGDELFAYVVFSGCKSATDKNKFMSIRKFPVGEDPNAWASKMAEHIEERIRIESAAHGKNGAAFGGVVPPIGDPVIDIP